MKKHRFQIVAKTSGRTLFFPLKNQKALETWMKTCAPLVNEEIHVYQHDGIGYNLLYSENKRKVGF